MDNSLGGVVETDEYSGVLLRGEPLHTGGCNDSEFGCLRCRSAYIALSDEDRAELGEPEMTACDWCHAAIPVQDSRLVRPWDEPSCRYEVCEACAAKHSADRDAALGGDPDSDNDDWGDEADEIRDANDDPADANEEG